MTQQKSLRDKLIEAATPFFAEKGFAAVSIRELSRVANTSSTLINDYFGSKEGFYAAVLEEQFAPALQALFAVVDASHLSHRERLHLFSERILSYQSQNPLFLQFLHNESTLPSTCGHAIVDNFLAQSLQCIRTILETGIRSGDFKANLDIAYAEIFWHGMINSHANLLLFHLPQRPNEIFIMQAVDLYLHGIAERSFG